MSPVHRRMLHFALGVSLLTLAPPAMPLLADTGCSTTITFGETLLCTLGTPGEVASFNFSANGGDRIIVRMGRSTSGLNPHIQIQAPGGSTVCEAYSYAAAVDTSACLLPSIGAYTILASNYNSTVTGGYGISLQRLNAPAGVSSLSFGQTALATIVAAGELDAYTFTASAGDTMLARMGSTAAGLSPHIRLFGPDGIKLCEAYNANYSGVDIAGCLLPTDGAYTIVVNDYNGADTGNYGITIQRVNNPAGGIALAFGTNSLAALGAAGDLDTYTFAAASGDTVLMRMGSSTFGLSPQIRLYGPDGVKVCEAYNNAVADTSGCIVPSSGSYTILANAHNSAQPGSYGFALQRLNNPSGAVDLKYRWPTMGTLAVAGGLATYTFSATANSSVAIQVSSPNTSIYPFLRLYVPDGTQLCEAYGYPRGVAISSCPLPTDGAYTLTVSNYGGAATGDFSLFLRCLTDSCGPTDLPVFNVYLPAIRS